MNKTDVVVKMTCIGKFIEKWDGAIKNALTTIKIINFLIAIKNINRSAALIFNNI